MNTVNISDIVNITTELADAGVTVGNKIISFMASHPIALVGVAA